MTAIKHTGLMCPNCNQPVALIETQPPLPVVFFQPPQSLVFFCPACGHRWLADEPGTPKQQ
jgi:hypothetical protein